MKTIHIMAVVGILLALLLLSACEPLFPECPEPVGKNDINEYCRCMHTEYFPDYPQSFIVACTSSLISDKPAGFHALCQYEPFRTDMEVETHKECIELLKLTEK